MTPSDRDDGPAPAGEGGEAFQLVLTEHHGRELRLRSEGPARVVSSVVAVLFAASLALWFRTAQMLREPCGQLEDQIDIDLHGCLEPPAFLRSAQFAIATVGVVVGAVVVAYLIRFAVTGRTWPFRRVVAAIFGVLAGVWVILYGVGAIYIYPPVFGALLIAVTLLFGLVTFSVWQNRRTAAV